MPRIRTIKPELATSEQIANCSTTARLMFILMWGFCDDNGIHPASLMRLKMEIFPADNFTKEDMQCFVNELLTQNLLEEYTANDKSYWIVTGWHSHQRIDQPTYKYPLPTGEKPQNPMNRRIKNVQSNKVSANERGGNAEVTHPEWNGEELKLLKIKADEKTSSALSPSKKNSDDEKGNSLKIEQPDVDDCPHQEIVALYHEILPECRQVKIWNDKRQKHLRSRWREKPQRQTLDWWRGFFSHVKGSPYLLGTNQYNWACDLEWLVCPSNFAKVIEGQYHGKRKEI